MERLNRLKRPLTAVTKAWHRVLVCLILVVPAFGCALHRPAGTLLPDSRTAHLLRCLKQQRKKGDTFKGVGDLRVKGRGAAQAMRVAWIGRIPDDLRIEVLGLWAQPTMTLLVRGDMFWAHIIKDHTVFTGKNTSKNLSRIVGIPIESQDLIALLSGCPPLSTFQTAEGYITKASEVCVFLYGPRKKRRQEVCFLNESSGTISRITRFNGWGDPQYTIGFEDFRSIGHDLIPFKIRIVESGSPLAALDIKKLERQIPLPDQAFSIGSSHARTIKLDAENAP